jgi:hypothetical protein
VEYSTPVSAKELAKKQKSCMPQNTGDGVGTGDGVVQGVEGEPFPGDGTGLPLLGLGLVLLLGLGDETKLGEGAVDKGDGLVATGTQIQLQSHVTSLIV